MGIFDKMTKKNEWNFVLGNAEFLTKVIKTDETGNPLPWPHRHSPELGGCPYPLRSHAVESLLQPRGGESGCKDLTR